MSISKRTSNGAANKASGDIINRILPDCYLYISHLDDGHQYWMLPGYPEKVTDQMNSSFMENTALGRSAPVYTFSNSGPRTIQITLSFHRDMFEEINEHMKSHETGDDLADQFIHAIQAIAVPRYNRLNKAVEPPLVAVRLGHEVFIKGIVSSGVTVTYGKPILVNEKYAIVEISFTISEVDPYDATTIFTNGSFRGLTATLRQGMNF